VEEYLAESQNTHTSVPEEFLIYESSNGDRWHLCENPTNGLPAVKHAANVQSGGNVSYLEVDSFLAGGNGPEHKALRQLLKQDHLATILIACDIHSKQESIYDELAEAVQLLGAWWHHLETVWIVRSDKTPSEIRDALAKYLGTDDQLLVADITGIRAEWAGINDAGSIWLNGLVNRDILAA
jgi:hypothetical protein